MKKETFIGGKYGALPYECTATSIVGLFSSSFGYRNDPITQSLLLSLNEGKTIEFVQTDKDGNQRVLQGKIIRSGYVPPSLVNLPYGQQPYPQPAPNAPNGAEQPVIEVNGKLQFSLPGQPVFATLADDTILKPTLSWELETDKPGPTNAEFSYVTGGMDWEASYNVVAPPKSNVLELVGWITLRNQSGRTFRDARLKLMAGDVNKVQPPGRGRLCNALRRPRTIRSSAIRPLCPGKGLRRISSLHQTAGDVRRHCARCFSFS